MTKKMLPQKPKTTCKKIKYVGTEEWINANTGEIQEFEVTQVSERDFNFTKVFMQNFLADLDALGNKKLKIAIYICENIDRDGYLIGTIRQIADATGTSYLTVQKTMKILVECNFIRRVNNGAYIVNADHLFKGTHTHRMNVLKRYIEVDEKGKELESEEEQAE